jgi:hypothetical protein
MELLSPETPDRGEDPLRFLSTAGVHFLNDVVHVKQVLTKTLMATARKNIVFYFQSYALITCILQQRS